MPTANERLDRVDAAIDCMAEESLSFQRVREAIMAQQDQIAEHSKQIGQLIEMSKEDARQWEQLRREFEAYLRRLPSQ